MGRGLRPRRQVLRRACAGTISPFMPGSQWGRVRMGLLLAEPRRCFGLRWTEKGPEARLQGRA